MSRAMLYASALKISSETPSIFWHLHDDDHGTAEALAQRGDHLDQDPKIAPPAIPIADSGVLTSSQVRITQLFYRNVREYVMTGAIKALYQ